MGDEATSDAEPLFSDIELDDAEYVDTASYMNSLWHAQAKENVEKWGLQSIGVLLCTIVEEVGEMAAEIDGNVQPATDDDPVDVYSMESIIIEMERLGLRAQKTHEAIYEDSEGNPRDGPELRFNGDMSRLSDELDDTVALLYQMQAALDRMAIGGEQ